MPLSAQLIMVKLSQNQSIVFIFVLFQSLELALVKTQAVVQSIVVVVLVVVVFSFFFFFSENSFIILSPFSLPAYSPIFVAAVVAAFFAAVFAAVFNVLLNSFVSIDPNTSDIPSP